MLAVTGRSSDGWVSPLSTYTPPSDVPAIQSGSTSRARGGPRSCSRAPHLQRGRLHRARCGVGLTGDVATWVDTLTDWAVGLGFDTFIFWPTTAPRAQLEIFVGEVVPAVRQAVSARRSQK